MIEMTPQERVEFEAFAREAGWSVERSTTLTGTHYYIIAHVQIAEQTWEAARKPLLAQRNQLLAILVELVDE